MRGRWLLTMSAVVAMSGCTSYVSVPHGSGSWAEAKRAAYGVAAAPGPAATSTPAPGPAASPPAAAADRGRPPPAEAAPLAPKPLAPLANDATATGARDVPVVEAAPTRVVMAPEPAPPPQPPSPQPTSAPAAADPKAERPAPPPAGRGTDVAAGRTDPLPPPSLSGVGFLWPVPSLGDTATVRESGGEGGLVIDAGAGETFVAAENGVVVFAADSLETYGNMVVVRHDGDYTTTYAHAETLDVDVGDVVRRGQRLGTVGASGAASAPQLYFEMRVGSRVVDPRAYLVGTPQLASR